MSDDDYGRKVGQALAAVRRMHADVSKLLVDAEGAIGKGKVSVFDAYATRDLTYHFKADFWMAEGVFRLYAPKPPASEPMVEGLTVRFFDTESRIEEPYLIVGQLKYRLEGGRTLVDYLKDLTDRTDKRGWHLWHAYSDWSGDRRQAGVVLTGGPLTAKRVEWFKVIGVPLFSITSMADVVALMKRVRDAEVPPTPNAVSPSDAEVDRASPAP